MWNRRRFILSFVLVALGALVAFGALVYAASMTALSEIRQDAAVAQWQLFQRALNALAAEQLQLTQDYAERDEVRRVARDLPAAAAELGQTLAPALERYHKLILLALTDDKGRPLYPLGAPSEQTQTVVASGPAQAALGGKDRADVTLIAGRPMLLAAAHVGLAERQEVYGALILGRPLDNALFEQLKNIVGRDLVLAREGQVIASSATLSRRAEEARRACDPSAATEAGRLKILTSPDGVSYVAVPLRNQAGDEMGCLQLDLPESIVPTMRAAITIASLVAILFGVAASYIVARAVGGRLAASAEALAAGERENARLYAEVQQLNSRLETLIGERTTQLRAAVSELQAAQAQLIRADRLAILGSLTASVVQDLASPLTVILANVQTLLQSETDPERVARLEEARRAALRCQDSLQRLRAFAGQQRARRELIGLNEIVRDAVALLAPQLQAAGIAYTLELHAALPHVTADHTQMQQVIFHMLQRARRALEGVAGRRALQVRTEPAGEMVRLVVADNAPAPTAASPATLFEPPVAAPCAEDAGEDEGLSLYVCRGIIEAHGGRIYAQAAAEGAGARLVIELPAGVSQLTRGLGLSSA